MNRMAMSVLPAALVAAMLPVCANGQYLMMPDSTNNRLVLFDPFDG